MNEFFMDQEAANIEAKRQQMQKKTNLGCCVIIFHFRVDLYTNAITARTAKQQKQQHNSFIIIYLFYYMFIICLLYVYYMFILLS